MKTCDLSRKFGLKSWGKLHFLGVIQTFFPLGLTFWGTMSCTPRGYPWLSKARANQPDCPRDKQRPENVDDVQFIELDDGKF